MMVYSRTKVLARRREVTSLLVRGVPPSEIAEMLNMPRHTIYNDIRVIRSAKNDALFAYTRNEIIAQLFLNAQERARYLWHTADNTDKDYVKVRAMQELRLNDERIFDRLSDPKHNPELEYSEAEVKEYIERYDGLRERVEQAEERRVGMEDTIRKWLEKGNVERAINYLSHRHEPPSDKSESA
jgi:transcriptional antiterminator